MAGFDDDDNNAVMMGEWEPASHDSPRSLSTTMVGDNKGEKPVPEPSADCETEELIPGSQGYMRSEDAEKKDSAQADNKLFEEFVSEQKPGTRASLSERIAARAGFNAPRLNTETIRSANLSGNPDIHSPYFTISPGLSPATLLDSPVFITNSLVQPSPTTGKFSFFPDDIGAILSSEAPARRKDNFFEDINNLAFAFKPASTSSPSFFVGATSKVAPANHPLQAFPKIEVSVESDNIHNTHRDNVTYQADISRSLPQNHNSTQAELSGQRDFDAVGRSFELSPPLDDQQDQQDEEQRCGGDLMTGGGAPSEDGYNWRKYGQKQVKGSEFPRSYYKCTHPNCLVKKTVERSPEGHITEITYKGAHNHPKPPPSRRSALGFSNPGPDVPQDASRDSIDSDNIWSNSQRVAPELRLETVEVTSSSSIGFEPAQNGNRFESGDAVDASSTLSNDEREDDLATHGSVSLGYDDEEDESASKRRKMEAYAAEMNGASRAIREPRVVVQTTSDVDILDDGYRWRKYGQKVVKGNPNPRSYYKCTSPGCTVRKLVERASHDLKSVITTYEGKHNHDVPAARNSSHGNSGGAAAQTAPPVQTHVHQPEPPLQVHSNMARFGRPVPFSPFSFHGRPQLGPASGFSFGMNQQGFANLSMAGLASGQAKLPVLPMHQYLQQQPRVSETGFMLPRVDPKVEPVSEPDLTVLNSSSIYQQIMNRLPLGPQM